MTKPAALIILDGFAERDETFGNSLPSKNSAISQLAAVHHWNI